MRPIYHLNIFQVSILAALFLRLEADSEDSDCEVDLKVARDTVYETVTGEDLRINCTVAFCNNSPPTVTWYKREKTDFPVDVSSRIKMEWELVNHSFLIFQNIFRSDSGVYQCQSGGIVSHNINVSVHESPAAQDTFWPYVYCVVGIMAFVIIVVAIYVGSRCGCKGKSRDTREPNHQPPRDAATTQI
ncbi:B- and T-lymphocyte attenuator-like isoform X2 [Epinephelus lanceolatus]